MVASVGPPVVQAGVSLVSSTSSLWALSSNDDSVNHSLVHNVRLVVLIGSGGVGWFGVGVSRL